MGGLVLPLLKVFATGYILLVAVSGPGQLVSAQTHHVVGGEEGWSSASNLTSWLSGRVFKVGDKLWFSFPATEDTIVELQSLEELVTCDIRNPIRMYADGSNHVTLDKEGTRYFSSANPENCKNGMKLPVSVQNHEKKYEPYPEETPEDEPYHPETPEEPFHPETPEEPFHPETPEEPYHPETPDEPHPLYPPPHHPLYPPPHPAASTALNVFLSVVFAGLYLSCIGL